MEKIKTYSFDKLNKNMAVIHSIDEIIDDGKVFKSDEPVNSVAFANSPSGRQHFLSANFPDHITAAVLSVWGISPTMEDVREQPPRRNIFNNNQ